MRSIQLSYKISFPILTSLAIFFFVGTSNLTAQDSNQQLEEVLKESSKKNEFIKKIPKWILASIWVSKNKVALLSPLISTQVFEKIPDEQQKIIITDFLDNKDQKKNIEIPFTLISFLKSKTIQIEATIKRLSFADTSQDLSQKFREIIQITSPSSLQHYKWTTFRFYRQTSDRVWITSGNIKQPRPISPWIRSESLFYSAFSADDLIGNSALLDNFDITVAPNLVFIPELKSPPSIKADSLNLENPTPSFSVEEKASYLITAVNKDPFAKIGKLEILVDSKTLIPLYKGAFDRLGKQLSLLVNAITDSNEISWSYKETQSGISTVMYGPKIIHSLDEWSPAMFDPYENNIALESSGVANSN